MKQFFFFFNHFACQIHLGYNFSFFSFAQADVIERLRLQYKKDLLKIVDIVLSHQVTNS